MAYDADEQLQNIERAAQGITNIAQKGYAFINWFRGISPSNRPDSGVTSAVGINDPNFVFRGNHTDLRFFSEHTGMDVSMVESIPDVTLKQQVKDAFNRAIAAGEVQMSPRGTMTLTKKGQRLIQSPEFQRQAAIEKVAYQQEQKAIAQNTDGFLLTGAETDLQYFCHQDSLNLAALFETYDKVSPETVEVIMDRMDAFREAGFVQFDSQKGILTVTNEGKIAANSMKQANAVSLHNFGEAFGSGGVGHTQFLNAEQIQSMTKMATGAAPDAALATSGVGGVIVAVKNVGRAISTAMSAAQAASSLTRS